MNFRDNMIDVLDGMKRTFEERRASYGEHFRPMGKIMMALFPEGLTIRTEEDFIRYHWITWVVGKLTRWTTSGMKNDDSILDAAVYCAMLAAWEKTDDEHGPAS